MTKIRSTSGHPVIYYVDEAEPSIEHWAGFITFVTIVECVIE